MPTNDELLEQLRSSNQRLEGLLKRHDDLLDDNRRFAGYVERLIRTQSEASGNSRLITAAITQVGYRIGAVELELANLKQALVSGDAVDAANTQVVAAKIDAQAAKIDRLHDDISGSHPIPTAAELAAMERGPSSRPPKGQAGLIYEFRKAPLVTQILLTLLALAIAFSGWLYHEIATGGRSDQVEERGEKKP